MAAKKTTQSKAAFVRSLPSTTSTVDVIAKGKAAGHKLTKNYVYKVRTEINAKKAAKAGKPTATATSTKTTTSKSDFVRAHAGLSPKEIVKKAKAEGVKLGVSYVYNVRGYDKSKAKKKPAKAAAPATKASAPTVKARATPRTAPPVPRPITTTSSAETLLRALGAEIGLGRAVEILAEERARVAAMIGGG